ILRFQGTPGSRNSRHPHEDSYARLDVRVIVADRPGYGESTRLPKRGISVVADDAAQLLDHLGLDRVHVIGGSGGGPHALAFAARRALRARVRPGRGRRGRYGGPHGPRVMTGERSEPR